MVSNSASSMNFNLLIVISSVVSTRALGNGMRTPGTAHHHGTIDLEAEAMRFDPAIGVVSVLASAGRFPAAGAIA